MSGKLTITRGDILPVEEYARRRKEYRRGLLEMKRHRRVAVGPYATFYFENRETMWAQIHEMLYIERGGEEQIAGELAAYAPLVPNGRELVATLMFEIPDEVRRRQVLAGLGGVEDTATMGVEGLVVQAVPERDVERTTAEGKTSSVHFLHFPFSEEQIALFRRPGAAVVLGIAHPAYGHMAVLPATVRAVLAEDFDQSSVSAS